MPAAALQEVTHATRAFFLPTYTGRLAAIYHAPQPGAAHHRDIVYAHPFGHELFSSRPVTAWLWRRLAAHGIGVLALDLPGCGDSEGDFADARWDTWNAALQCGIDWLSLSRRPLTLCGLRLGAALALDAARDSRAAIERIILLQPVLSGEEMLTQFLRLRVAFSGLRDLPQKIEKTKRETTHDLRNRLAAGELLEVAGYEIAPELARAIDRVVIPQSGAPAKTPIVWLETVAEADADPPPASRAACTAWHARGFDVTMRTVPCKPYWVHTRAEVTEYEALAQTLLDVCGARTHACSVETRLDASPGAAG